MFTLVFLWVFCIYFIWMRWWLPFLEFILWLGSDKSSIHECVTMCSSCKFSPLHFLQGSHLTFDTHTRAGCVRNQLLFNPSLHLTLSPLNLSFSPHIRCIPQPRLSMHTCLNLPNSHIVTAVLMQALCGASSRACLLLSSPSQSLFASFPSTYLYWLFRSATACRVQRGRRSQNDSRHSSYTPFLPHPVIHPSFTLHLFAIPPYLHSVCAIAPVVHCSGDGHYDSRHAVSCQVEVLSPGVFALKHLYQHDVQLYPFQEHPGEGCQEEEMEQGRKDCTGNLLRERRRGFKNTVTQHTVTLKKYLIWLVWFRMSYKVGKKTHKHCKWYSYESDSKSNNLSYLHKEGNMSGWKWGCKYWNRHECANDHSAL